MIKIGTNFSYNGKDFLDIRQGEADSKDDLLNWDRSLNIPDGFEVFVRDENSTPPNNEQDNQESDQTPEIAGDWYIYCPNLDRDPETGYFRKRIDLELSRSEDIRNMQTQINTLLDGNTDVTLTVKKDPSTSTWEVGSTITSPKITWSVTKDGETVTPSKVTISVNGGSPINITNTNPWTGNDVSTNTSYKVTATVKGITKNLTESSTVSYSFSLKKYYGVSENDTLTNSEILRLPNQPWAESWRLSETVFDCTPDTQNGPPKYPYYIIPKSLYSASTFKCFAGGFDITQDLEIEDRSVKIDTGLFKDYKIIRFGRPQHGRISIRFGS